ncbi:MAG: hypothetical protein WCG51_02020, partial [Elusimicrobiota bacterium]
FNPLRRASNIRQQRGSTEIKANPPVSPFVKGGYYDGRYLSINERRCGERFFVNFRGQDSPNVFL